MGVYDETVLLDGTVFLQEKDGFRFGVDIVLLADFIREFAKEEEDNLEIGTGNGILPVLLQKRNFSSRSYVALDILKSNIELAKKNFALHKTEVEAHCCDVKEWTQKNYYSQIFVNPPYMKLDGKLLNENYVKAIARHEISLDLETLFQTAKKLLKPIGQLYLVHRSQRLQEILTLAEKYSFSISRMAFVYHGELRESKLVLLELYKGKKGNCHILEPRYMDCK